MTETDGPGSILARSVPLAFARTADGFRARTPAGEYAWSEAGGLREWRRVALPGGWSTRVLIWYSGGDAQGSDRDGFWQRDPSGAVPACPYPHAAGFDVLGLPVRLN